MRGIDDLSPLEQAKIAANVYVTMADDSKPLPRKRSELRWQVTVAAAIDKHVLVRWLGARPCA
ncbi:hypothetical protein GCM10007857_51700 [Bradyrhizobium iriomotense]|uniref:Uncharacterized protein n=1 Tax=Bradyrhizobium iriomotense TaxID=441950 RepID=A0ABQ6B3W3_9BRAD|nr:hypothetical protein GCM10007857_51700 [Bradyrhizobium iriomotense]